MDFKRNVYMSIIVFMALLFFTSLVVFVIDPMQHYRKATLYKPYGLKQRHMAWGLLKHYNYDSLLIGSSVTESFRKDYIDADLNLDVLRIPFQGLSSYEAHLLMKEGLKNKNLSTIIYGLDLENFAINDKKSPFHKKPLYLMNDSIVDDWKYLLNADMLFKGMIKIVASNYLNIKKYKTDFNRLWHTDEHTYSKQLCIYSYYVTIKNDPSFKFKIKALRASFNKNILPYYENNKNVKFKIFFPPYPILKWKIWEHQKNINILLEFKKYIIEQSIKYKNITVYDFQIAQNITHNLNNYRDDIHYSPSINRWISSQIKNDKYIVSKNTINKYLNQLKEQIHNYIPPKKYKRTKEALKTEI